MVSVNAADGAELVFGGHGVELIEAEFVFALHHF